jgi:amino acid transporter
MSQSQEKDQDSMNSPGQESSASQPDHRLPHPEDDFDLILLGKMQERQGHKLGNQRIRIIKQSRPFVRIKDGLLESTEEAEKPEGSFLRLLYWTKRALIGVPIATSQAEHQRLTKFKALAILSSDAISSVAFATEAILVNLVVAGSQHLWLTLPISLVIIALLVIVAISYRQTIPAYPNGGGSYTVARENLGTTPGLVAAAALMIDYVLNVSVCVAAGVHNLVSLIPALAPTLLYLDIGLVVIITLLNLRGVRESGSIFAFPTYFFIVSSLLLIIVGLVKAFVLNHQPLIGQFTPTVQAIEPLSLFVILRAFATGCSAMTGVEAISNGVPVFQKPETRNASITLTWMATILGALFLGITLLTMTYAVQASPTGDPTVIAQIALRVFNGPLFFFYPIFLLAVLGILTLSAETSYADFPRLASLLARDGYLPRQFAFRGDRLAFSVGIVVLAVMAGLLIIVFNGDTNQLINLFAVGVFVSFTLSQAGMVVHWWRLRTEIRGWRRRIIMNGTGAVTTLLVTLVVATMKFLQGAWLVVILIPILVWLFQSIHRYYQRVEKSRTFNMPVRPQDIHHRFIVPIDRLDQAAIQSIAYARSVSSHVIVVHVTGDNEDTNQLREQWQRWQKYLGEEEETHLLIIESPYRSLLRPLLAYVDAIHERHPEDTLTVVLPEFVVVHWWEGLLHNQTALRLKAALLFRPGIAVLNLPQRMTDRTSQSVYSSLPQ